MQVHFSYLICPECHARNTPWRAFCKACRGPIDSRQRARLYHTDVTVTLYRAADPQTRLLISPQYLAFEAPGVSIQSAWENIAALRSDFAGAYLSLRQPAVLFADNPRFLDRLEAGRRIPLSPFGYPEHAPLGQDLLRFLPRRLRRRIPG